MSQKSFFKLLAFLGLFFIPLRTVFAVAPHKTGAQLVTETNTTDAFWAGFGVTLIAIAAGTAFWIVQGEKPKRYDN